METVHALDELSTATRSQDEVLGEVVTRMLEAGNPLRVILFGSRARHDAKPDSDYDFLVIEESSLPRYRRAAIRRPMAP